MEQDTTVEKDESVTSSNEDAPLKHSLCWKRDDTKEDSEQGAHKEKNHNKRPLGTSLMVQ